MAHFSRCDEFYLDSHIIKLSSNFWVKGTIHPKTGSFSPGLGFTVDILAKSKMILCCYTSRNLQMFAKSGLLMTNHSSINSDSAYFGSSGSISTDFHESESYGLPLRSGNFTSLSVSRDSCDVSRLHFRAVPNEEKNSHVFLRSIVRYKWWRTADTSYL